MADLATFIPTRRQPTGPVETFSTERAAETVDREIATEDTATILLRFENGARGTVAISQLSAGPQELARVRDRRLDRVDRLGLGAAGPALDRPPRHGERDPHPQPGAHGRRRAGRRGAAGRPRRGLRRHLPRPLPRRSTPTSAAAGRRSTPSIRPSPTVTTRCWSATPSRRAPATAAGRRSTVPRRHRCASWRTRYRHEARIPDSPAPRHPARRRLPPGPAQTASRASRSPAGRGRRAPRDATPARRTSTSPTCPRRRPPRSWTRSPRTAWRSPGSATTRTRCTPTARSATRRSRTRSSSSPRRPR